MRKIIVAISMLLVIAMTFAVPTFGAEEVSTAALNLEKYGQKTCIVGDPIASAPIVDGIIDEGEYSASVKFDGPVIWTTGQSHTQEMDSTEMEDWMNSESITYYYAYDEDNIYIAFYDVQGYQDETHWIYRNNYILRFGFNIGDFSEYFSINLTGNNGDYTSVGEKPSIGMANADGNSPVPDEEKAIIAAYATKTPLDETLTGLKATDATQWVRQFEVVLNKAQLLNMFNFYCGTNYAELPNAMLITHGNRSYREFAPVGVAAAAETVHSLWNCAKLTPEHQAELGTDFIYVPNAVIFGKELVVPKVAEDTEEETEPPVDDTDAPADDTQAPADDTTAAPADDTQAPADDTQAPADEGGCGATVGFAGMALVATLGTSAYFVSKKKRR